jgi:deferrochelatase/peroxidase EfeB
MTDTLDLADIQGGILRAYGRQGFPKGRTFFLKVNAAAQGRRLVMALRPRITTASRWSNPRRSAPLVRGSHPRMVDVVRARDIQDYPGVVRLAKPQVAINIAFTFLGLLALEVPVRTLRGMPDEFIEGMASRATLLGDAPFRDRRDAIWRNADAAPVHIMISMNAEMNPDGSPVQALLDDTAWLEGLCAASEGGVEILGGHGPSNAAWQDMSAVLAERGGVLQPTNKEHFGLSDGFGDPVFEGQYPGPAERLRVIGQGKLTGAETWEPLATGEFLLGHPDEAQEIPGAAMPIDFSRNGTFMAWRKLHENVGAFQAYIAAQAPVYAAVMGLTDLAEAADTLKAKIVGRWPDGVPLMAAPTHADWLAFQARLEAATARDDKAELARLALAYVDFKYRPDPAGAVCPVTAHLRRANTRDMLDPNVSSPNKKAWEGSALNNRRRFLRRGLPYGTAGSPTGDADEQGIIFIAVCASLFRQFEFVQQQWIQYGLDFNAGNDTCPLLGNHGPAAGQMEDAKFVIPADPASGKPPFICPRLPQLVEPRGGDYVFAPSMTALRMIGMGIVDPT